MESISPSKTPFITATDDNVDDGPTSPFHAMDDEDGILVKANDSDISMPAKNIDEEAEKGILMVKLSDSSKLAEVNQEQIDALYDDDNNSINSTLKVHQGSADFDYDDIKRGKLNLERHNYGCPIFSTNKYIDSYFAQNN